MSLQGPIVVVADSPVPEVVDSLAGAGAFPIVETEASGFTDAIASIEPAAIVLADPRTARPAVLEALEELLADSGPYVPVIARANGIGTEHIGHVLPVAHDAPVGRLIARLRAALRVRTLHASVLRRVAALEEHGDAPAMPTGDPLDDATVLVCGRGGRYPALVVAVGERTGLVGALSLESALQMLRARDIDGLAIGEGFNRRSVERFIGDLASDPRFRDLPIAVIDDIEGGPDAEQLPNLCVGAGDPTFALAHLIPLVRLRAFAARLRRMMASLDAKGMLDPDTGLRRSDVFFRDLARAVGDAEKHGVALSLARFSLASLTDRRASLDAARIVARLVRAADFGCRDRDGTILVTFTETDQRAAHVVARRIASVLKHTTLAAGHDRRELDPTVTIVAFKSPDTAQTLLARVSRPDCAVAAG